VGVFVLRGQLFPNGGAAARPTQVQADERRGKTPAPVPTFLVGRWRRSDGGYILDIGAVGDDGTIDATYLNPRPIHVAKAEAITEGGHVVVIVTLQDRGYPGNIYTLTYDAQADSLGGIYHHRGLRQQFDVVFTRLPSAQSTQE
jgi:hypothetical protein